jgi:predicted DCC family thiol-disulfide oxidoreductase YuxK
MNPVERIMVYDGFCNICSGWARFMSRHPIAPPFRHVAMQSEAGRALLTEKGIDPEDPATFLVLDRGLVLTDSEGAIHVMASLGGAWRLAHALRVMPKVWRDGLYRVLARNRYRWFGKRETCYLPGMKD